MDVIVEFSEEEVVTSVEAKEVAITAVIAALSVTEEVVEVCPEFNRSKPIAVYLLTITNSSWSAGTFGSASHCIELLLAVEPVIKRTTLALLPLVNWTKASL